MQGGGNNRNVGFGSSVGPLARAVGSSRAADDTGVALCVSNTSSSGWAVRLYLGSVLRLGSHMQQLSASVLLVLVAAGLGWEVTAASPKHARTVLPSGLGRVWCHREGPATCRPPPGCCKEHGGLAVGVAQTHLLVGATLGAMEQAQRQVAQGLKVTRSNGQVQIRQVRACFTSGTEQWLCTVVVHSGCAQWSLAGRCCRLLTTRAALPAALQVEPNQR